MRGPRSLAIAIVPTHAPRGRRVGHAIIGAVAFHGLSDRDSAGAAIDAQILALTKAVVTAAGGDASLIRYRDAGPLPDRFIARAQASRDAMEKSPYIDLWDNGISPLFNEWNKFYEDKHHWYDAVTEFFTSWEDYVSWLNRVIQMRDKIEKAGIRLALPPIQPLTRSAQDIIQDTASDAKDEIASMWHILKYGLVAALGLGGVILLMFASKGRSVRSLYR